MWLVMAVAIIGGRPEAMVYPKPFSSQEECRVSLAGSEKLTKEQQPDLKVQFKCVQW